MRTRSDILYRLGPFLVGVFPEMAATILLAIILDPSILVGPALWLLEGFASDMVLSFLRLMFLLYVWAILPRHLRYGLLSIAAAFLPNRMLRHLGVIHREGSNTAVGMDSPKRTRIPETWTNDLVEIELYANSSDPERFERRYGILLDVNDLGILMGKTFYTWNTIRAISHRQERRSHPG